jgi:DUF4097 and DUF4098 domain-containing protein YvlB
MKTSMTLLLAVFALSGMAQQFTEKINKEYTFEKKSSDNAIVIANLNGSVKVTGYEGDKVLVEVNRTITGKTETRLQHGKDEVKLGVIDRADTLIFYVEDGCNEFGKNRSNRRKHGKFEGGWSYNNNWNFSNGHNCRMDYDYKMDFVIKVPASINVIASTINDGNVTIENVKGSVDANNINGSIRLTNLVREADASTINGDVDVDYSTNPSKDCRFYSLNGDINALFQKGLAASMSFESFNGSFYTNVNNLEPLPVKVEKTAEGEGIKYKVNGNRYKIGNGGGAFLDFETFNGNVYLKEKTN